MLHCGFSWLMFRCEAGYNGSVCEGIAGRAGTAKCLSTALAGWSCVRRGLSQVYAQRIEPFHIEAFIVQPSVKALYESVLYWATRTLKVTPQIVGA